MSINFLYDDCCSCSLQLVSSLVSVCFNVYIIFSTVHHILWNRISFCVSICLFQQGSVQKSSWPVGLLGWPSKTYGLSRRRVAVDWPLALFHWKRTPTGLLVALKICSFICLSPPYNHSTILIIMTLNENLHTGPIYKHTKELRCSSASQ